MVTMLQADYDFEVTKAKLVTLATADKAKKRAADRYDRYLEQMLECHRGLFAMYKLKDKLLQDAVAEDDEHGSASGSQKRGKATKKGVKGKGKGKSSAKPHEKDKEAQKEKSTVADEQQSMESEDEDELTGNMPALDYLDIALEHFEELDAKIRGSLSILQIAIQENWQVGQAAQDILEGERGKTLLEKARSKVNEESKKRKADDGYAGAKRMRQEEERPRGRGRGRGTGRRPYEDFGGNRSREEHDVYYDRGYDRRYDRNYDRQSDERRYDRGYHGRSFPGEGYGWTAQQDYSRQWNSRPQYAAPLDRYRAPVSPSGPPPPPPPPPPPKTCFRCADPGHRLANCPLRQ